MPLWKKKADPLSERARALQRQIAALEAQIRDLQTTLAHAPPAPPGRSALSPGATAPSTELRRAAEIPRPAPTPSRPASVEPVFEEVGRGALQPAAEPPPPPDLYNEMGVRKFDFTALVRRLRQRWHHTPTLNPRLISYLAAGGVQGLRPLRKEKRVARNRFLLLAAILLLLLLGTFWMFLQHR